MTHHVPVDPVCLDLPDHGLCQGDPPPPPAAGGREPGTCRISPLPCFGLATIFHGLILVLGLTLAVSSELPNSVISISLLPGLADTAPPPGPGQGFGDPFEPASSPVAEPVTTEAPTPEPEKSRPVKPKPKKPVPVASRQAPKIVEKPDPPAVHEDQTADASDDAGDDVRESGATAEPGSVTPGQAATGISGGGSADGTMGGGRGGGAGPVNARFGDADGPRFVDRVMPRYPELARRRGREGIVLLRLTIDATGTLRDAQIVEKAGFGFDEAALEAARASTYAPARRFGQPVDCVALLPVRFALKSG